MKEDLNSASQLGWGHSEAAARHTGCVRSWAVVGWCLSGLPGCHQGSQGEHIETKVTPRFPVGGVLGQIPGRLVPGSLLACDRVSGFSRPHSGPSTSCFLSLLLLLPSSCPPHVCAASGDSDLSPISLLFPHSSTLRLRVALRKIGTQQGHQGCHVLCLS